MSCRAARLYEVTSERRKGRHVRDVVHDSRHHCRTEKQPGSCTKVVISDRLDGDFSDGLNDAKVHQRAHHDEKTDEEEKSLPFDIRKDLSRFQPCEEN